MVAWGLAAMRRDRWHGIVGFAADGWRRPCAGARGGIQVAEELGIPWSLAQAVADHVDWHQVARLVQHGCPPRLALNIVR